MELTREEVLYAIQKIESPEFTHSASKVKAFLKSPYDLLKYVVGKQDETDAMKVGSFVHKMYLEPDLLGEEYIVIDKKVDRRLKEDTETTIGKFTYAEIAAEAELKGKKVIDSQRNSLAKSLVASLRRSQTCEGLRKRATGFEYEFNVPFHSNSSEYRFRGFIDILGDDFIVDLKNIAGFSMENISRKIREANTDIQMAIYQMAEFQRCGQIKECWVFAVNPTSVLPIYIPQSRIDAATDKIHKYFEAFEKCRFFNEWESGMEFHTERGYYHWH